MVLSQPARTKGAGEKRGPPKGGGGGGSNRVARDAGRCMLNVARRTSKTRKITPAEEHTRAHDTRSCMLGKQGDLFFLSGAAPCHRRFLTTTHLLTDKAWFSPPSPYPPHLSFKDERGYAYK